MEGRGRAGSSTGRTIGSSMHQVHYCSYLGLEKVVMPSIEKVATSQMRCLSRLKCVVYHDSNTSRLKDLRLYKLNQLLHS